MGFIAQLSLIYPHQLNYGPKMTVRVDAVMNNIYMIPPSTEAK